MRIFTIGFTKKSAEHFFGLLRSHGVRRVVDVRLRPYGQLAGFARKEDLPYFLERLVDGCEYVHMPLLAPTDALLDGRRSGQTWEAYAAGFEALMEARNVPAVLDQGDFERLPTCLLCSEDRPDECHRRLLAERLQTHWPGIEIIHLR
jgi:uncharacterized protein (DUF488 family)